MLYGFLILNNTIKKHNIKTPARNKMQAGVWLYNIFSFKNRFLQGLLRRIRRLPMRETTSALFRCRRL